MSFDQKQNTEALQERQRDVYKKFFTEHDLVVSVGALYTLTPGLDHSNGWIVGGPMISQKLPLRMHVGVRMRNGRGSIRFGRSLSYQSKEDAFDETDYRLSDWAVVLPYLENFVAEKTKSSDFPSIELNILIEAPQSKGFDTTLESTLLIAVSLFYNLMDVQFLENISRLSYTKLQDSVAVIFREIFYYTLRLTALASHGYATGASSYPAIFFSEYPFVYFTQERALYHSDKGFSLEDVSTDEALRVLQYWGFRLDELYKQVKGEFPLDVVAIHIGGSREPEDNIGYLKDAAYTAFEQIQHFTRESFRFLLDEKATNLPRFLKNVNTPGTYWYEYNVGTTYHRLFLLRALVKLYRERLDQVALRSFLDTLNTLFLLRTELFEGARSFDSGDVVSTISRRAEEVGVPVGFRSLFLGTRRDNVLVFTPQRSFRDEIGEIIEGLGKKYAHLSIDFCSWRDGWGKDGVRVEQFISKGIYSKFVSQESYRLREWDGKSGEVERITEDVEKTKGEFDILLDKVDGKIYIKGEECTSRELPTQKAAIEILEYLLTHEGETVPNKALPAQTYTRYRNEFQGKIVTPLNQLLKKRLGKDLGLKIHGKLMVFDVQFKPVDLKIGILEKMG